MSKSTVFRANNPQVAGTASYAPEEIDVTITLNTEKARGKLTGALIEAIQFLFEKLGLRVNIAVLSYVSHWEPYEWSKGDYQRWYNDNNNWIYSDSSTTGTVFYGEYE